MDTTTDATRNLMLATDFVKECWDPPRPQAFARFTTSEQAVSLFAAFAAAFPDARLEVRWTVADDRRVALGGRLCATHLGPWRDVAATGRPITVTCAMSFAIDAGAIVDVAVVNDSLAIAEQIGAVPPLGPRACERSR